MKRVRVYMVTGFLLCAFFAYANFSGWIVSNSVFGEEEWSADGKSVRSPRGGGGFFWFHK